MRELLKSKKNDLPTLMIIFGAAGNLAHKKLFPAIFTLIYEKKLDLNFQILGFSRKDFNPKQYRESLLKSLKKDQPKVSRKTWDKFSPNVNYLKGDFEDREKFNEIYRRVEDFKKENNGKVNVIFYLAAPPPAYYTILNNIQTSNLRALCLDESTSIVVEKPFGEDAKSAKILNRELTKSFKEKQIFRIDHYLGKETEQNILVFRFANQIFTPAWDKDSIDHIQISILESAGIESRGSYYDDAGALRDIIQNHGLGLLANIAMERPEYFDEEHIRSERTKVLESLRFYTPDETSKFTVRGQYEGYRNEPEVNRASHTETFVAMKLFIDNERWGDVPIYIRTGKKLKGKQTKVVIKFKDNAELLVASDYSENTLIYKLQPDEGFELNLLNKVPGKEEAKPVKLDFNYADAFKEKIPTPYETLILGIVAGDTTLFVRSDEIEACWDFVDHIRVGWNKTAPVKFPNYKVGSMGPEAADELIKKDGRKWID